MYAFRTTTIEGRGLIGEPALEAVRKFTAMASSILSDQLIIGSLLEIVGTCRFRQELACLLREGIELELIVSEGYFPFGPLQESRFSIVASLERLFAFDAITPKVQRQAFGMQGSIGRIERAVFEISSHSLKTIFLAAKGRDKDRFKNVRITGKTQFDIDGFFIAVRRLFLTSVRSSCSPISYWQSSFISWQNHGTSITGPAKFLGKQLNLGALVT